MRTFMTSCAAVSISRSALRRAVIWMYYYYYYAHYLYY
jgi:hypothetical protein